MLVVPFIVELLEAIMPILIRAISVCHPDKTPDEHKEILKDALHKVLH